MSASFANQPLLLLPLKNDDKGESLEKITFFSVKNVCTKKSWSHPKGRRDRISMGIVQFKGTITAFDYENGKGEANFVLQPQQLMIESKTADRSASWTEVDMDNMSS